MDREATSRSLSASAVGQSTVCAPMGIATNIYKLWRRKQGYVFDLIMKQTQGYGGSERGCQ